MSHSSKVVETWENQFKQFSQKILEQLKESEHLTINLCAEESLFTRFNHSKVRQTIEVNQYQYSLHFILDDRDIVKELSSSGNVDEDIALAQKLLEEARQESQLLPKSLVVVYPENNGSTHENLLSDPLDPKEIHDKILAPVQNVDFVGLLVSGTVGRGNINSRGQSHWFSSENFYIDYSLYSEKQKAVKGTFAGRVWNQEDWETNINDAIYMLNKMELPVQEIKKGKYKTYFAPAATSEFLGLLNWAGVSGMAYKTGMSPLKALFDNEKFLSEKVSFGEDFSLRTTPKFNHLGEIAPEKVIVVENGKAKNLLVNKKTSNEYSDLITNGAGGGEGFRSLAMSPGKLKKEDILKELGTGLFISNLHYLNYSDRQNARVTGMTRFACFWVQNGEIKGPIRDLRFDETYYNALGENLVDITDFVEVIPNVDSYEMRGIGAVSVPGLLVNNFSYTL